jgi:peroxiredoxin
MNLENELHNYFELTPKDEQEIMLAQMRNLIKTGIMENVLKEGDTLPSFSLTEQTGQPIHSTHLMSQGPLVISFYRGAWCPYCNMELKALQSVLPEIRKTGAELIAISPNHPDNGLSLKEKYDLKFEVLSDTDNLVAKKFGLVFPLEKNLWDNYKKAGMDLEVYNGNNKWEIPIPATYIVDKGKIVLAYIDVDWTKRLEPSEIVSKLKELKKKELV